MSDLRRNEVAREGERAKEYVWVKEMDEKKKARKVLVCIIESNSKFML